MLGLLHRDVVLREPLHRPCEPPVALDRGRIDARDDEGRPRLIDEDGVSLIYDRKGMTALHALVRTRDHVVAQVVKAELAVGAIGDVGEVGIAPLDRIHVVLQAASAHAQALVDSAHPLAVAPGEVVVHGDNVDAPARNGI